MLVTDLEQARRNVVTLNRELAPLDREEEDRGFREIDTLEARIERGAIPIEEAIPLFLQMSEAMEAAHDTGRPGGRPGYLFHDDHCL